MAVTPADVAVWGRFKAPAGDELALLQRVIDASAEVLERDYVITIPPTATEELAVIMQSARYWKRRDTPEGRSAFGGDIAVTITSFDPDIDAMLTPQIGFA